LTVALTADQPLQQVSTMLLPVVKQWLIQEWRHTWYAAEVDLNVEKSDLPESPFRIRHDFDALSRLINCLAEREMRATHLLQSQVKQ